MKLMDLLLLCLRRTEQRKIGGKYDFLGLSFLIFFCVDYGCCRMLVYSFPFYFFASFVTIAKLNRLFAK